MSFWAMRSETPLRKLIDIPYKNLYKLGMTSDPSNTRIKWEGNTQKEIRSWPDDARSNIGNDLSRLERYEDPLDSEPLGKSLPGVHKLNDEDKDFWYRVMYTLHRGWIYVLHCFKKKTNKISKNDIKLAKQRLSEVERRNDPPAEREDKSA
jgi:phage-related protein